METSRKKTLRIFVASVLVYMALNCLCIGFAFAEQYEDALDDSKTVTEETTDQTTENIKKAQDSLNQGTQNTQKPEQKMTVRDNINDDSGTSDILKNSGISKDSMARGSEIASPLVNLIGYVVGAIVAITATAIFLITALDLLYIAFPPVRGLLYQGGTDGVGQMTGGRMGGMYGGFGGAGAMGGYGGGSMPQSQSGILGKKQWVSDEAISAVALLGGSAPAAGVDAFGGTQMNTQAASKKSVIASYFAKRAVFMVLFAIATVVLTSSILIGTGLNLAEWIMSLIVSANNYIPN